MDAPGIAPRPHFGLEDCIDVRALVSVTSVAEITGDMAFRPVSRNTVVKSESDERYEILGLYRLGPLIP